MTTFGQGSMRGRLLLGQAGILLCLFVLAVAGCDKLRDKPEASPAKHVDLLIGYNLLQDTLSGEGGLGTLRFYKKVTLGNMNEDVENLMKVLGEVSKERAKELEELRKLEPAVTGKPPPSPICDGIQAAAKEAGKDELLHPKGTFSVRFLFLQAQATRMIAVMAAETAKIEPNAKRRRWLEALATEYEGFRDDVVTVAQKHSRFAGDES